MQFIAKTQLAEQGRSCLQPVAIPPLSSILSPDMEEIKSCPVRALNIYMRRTRGFREDTTRLFISHKTGRDIQKGTISGWLKKTVSLAYELSTSLPREQQQVLKIRAHDIRAFSASWALLKGVALDTILQAGSWKSHTTFTSFYLRDLTQHNLKTDERSIGPLVVAGTATK